MILLVIFFFETFLYSTLGTVYLEMKKSPAPYFWRNIHMDQFKKLPNQHMWWDVYYNYMEDFNSYGANALLLFDQRELERERKEEAEEFEAKMKKRDLNLQKKRNAKIQKDALQAFRNKMVTFVEISILIIQIVLLVFL